MSDKEKKNKLFIIQQATEYKPKLQYIDNQFNQKEIIKLNKDSNIIVKSSLKNNDINKNKITIEKKNENEKNLNNCIYSEMNNLELDTNNKNFAREPVTLYSNNLTSRSKIVKNYKNDKVMNENKNIKQNNGNISNESNENIINKESNSKFIKKDGTVINYFINQNLLKYNTNNQDYENILIEHIVMNRNIHIVAVLKDHMIYDYKDEFLKRYYTTQESYVRLPIFANYYQNYLKFFCIPVFRELNLNKIAQNHGDNKAELYYVNNYGRRDLTENNINNMNINYDENCSVHYEYLKMRNILTTTIRENIEETVITKNDGIEENSLVSGSFVDFKINDNGLRIFYNKVDNMLEKNHETIQHLGQYKGKLIK
jgi:hypothetical protein